MKKSFYIAGGDLRSVYLAKALFKEGHEVKTFALEKADLPEGIEKNGDIKIFEKAENIILPLPCSYSEGFLKTAFSEKKITVSEIVEHLPEGYAHGRNFAERNSFAFRKKENKGL